jgi:energy-coupling factor transporter ATP-binding protein EcfA2
MAGRRSLNSRRPTVFTPFLRRFTDEPARELSETIELYNTVRATHRASVWAQPDVLERVRNLIASTVGRLVELPNCLSVMEAFDACSLRVLTLETTIFSFPEIEWPIARLSMKEQLDLRRFLRAKEYFLANEDRVSHALVLALGNVFGGLIKELPPLAERPVAFTIPLYALLPNAGEIVDRIIDTFNEDDHQTLGLFTTLMQTFYENLCDASGITPYTDTKRKLITANDSELPADQLIDTYLRNTPFHELLQTPAPFSIPEIPYRQEHTHILGPSGSGKTTLIQQLVLEDLAKADPPGMVIIDPKGLLIERLQSLAVFNPDTGRLKDRLVIVDPTHNPPPALNMFHAASKWNRLWSDDERRRIENQVIGAFAFVFSSTGSKLTDKQATPFGYAVRLMFHMESTIHTLVDLMDDPTRTDEKKGPTLAESKFAPFIGRLDDVSRRFFQSEFFSSNYRETRQQIKARIYGVLQHPEFVRMFESRERKLDMLDCLQNRSIVLVNTGMNTMGSDASQLLGRYIIALTLNAAFARFTIPKQQWHQAHLIIDEFQEFADDEKTPELLRLAREYKLAVTLAHQEMHGSGMTDKVRSAVSTNTTVKYASRPEGVDINYVARDMRCDSSFLTQQTKTATHARFACFVRGLLDHPVSLTIPFGNIGHEPQMSKEAHRRLLKANAALLSSPKQESRIESKAPRPLPQTVPAPVADNHPDLGDAGEPATKSSPSETPDSGSTW